MALPNPSPTPSTAAHVPLTVAVRGDAVESVHYGSVAVVDSDGRLLFAAGDAHALTFTRSALKPLQALPFVRNGGPERFGFDQAQVALLCASHSGEPRHVDAVADMLARAGNAAPDLACGTHVPGFYDARGEVPPPPPYSPLAHNCSGKHAGMLACCVLHGWRKHDYVAFDHPLQQEIRGAVADFAGMPEDGLLAGIDGCSAPNYAMPLANIAQAFARLATAEGDDPRFGRAPARLRDAMVAHPEMVSGERRSDLLLSQAGRGDWIPKIGAEGVQAIGVRSRCLGLAVKVADGSKRGLFPAVVAVLDQLGLLDEGRRAHLSGMRDPIVSNYRGIATGVVRPVVVLDRPPANPESL
jgi:L-asparaginase II